MANEQTRGTTDFATQTDSGSDMKGRAREVVGQAKERATEKIESTVSAQKSRAADTLTGVAQTLLSSSQQLRDQNQEGASRAMERAAEGVERFATYLQQTNVDDVVDQVHEFARRQPAAFIGGAFALGFIASRFVKATTPDDRRYLYGTTDGATRTNTGYNAAYDTSRGYAEGGSVGGAGFGTTSPRNTDDLGDGSPGITGGNNAGSR